MALTKEQMDALDKQAAADDEREAANAAKFDKWHASPEYAKLKEDADHLIENRVPCSICRN